MALILIVLLFCVSVWSLIALFRRLRRIHASGRLWLAFVVLILLGVAVGYRCSFHGQYQLRDDFRVASFPIPIVFFRLEEGNWMDYPVPDYQVWPTAVTNIFIVTAVATVPLWLWSRTKKPKTTGATQEP